MRGVEIVGVEMEQGSVPRQMHGISGPARPCRLGFVEERQTLARASFHLQDVSDDMDGARMAGVEGERPTRRLFGLSILAVLLEAEGVHRKQARVVARFGVPIRKDLCDPVPQHASPAKAEVERVGERERDDVARPIDDDRPIAFERERGVRPQARRARPPRDGARDRSSAPGLDRGHAFRSAGRAGSLSARTISARRRQ